MSKPVIITCAITGGDDTAGRFPAVPVTPQQIADSAIEACKAGAAIAHIHVQHDSPFSIASRDMTQEVDS